MLKNLFNEIQDILCPELYMAYHEELGGHMYSRHIHVSVDELKKRARSIKVRSKNDIIAFSRFYGDPSSVLPLVYECLIRNAKHIEMWLGSDHALELSMEFPEPIGDAIVVGTDWKYLFDASCIRIILLPPLRNSNRMFLIETAYPAFNLDETDMVWDAKDQWHIK